MAAGEGNGVVSVEKEGGNNNNISHIISGWFSEISPMWPGNIFLPFLHVPFSRFFVFVICKYVCVFLWVVIILILLRLYESMDVLSDAHVYVIM